MTKHTIEIEGLPEGWEPVKLIVGSSTYHNQDGTEDKVSRLVLQKTKPRRIVFEETGEANHVNLDGYFETQSFDKGSLLIYNESKIWRIKEE